MGASNWDSLSRYLHGPFVTGRVSPLSPSSSRALAPDALSYNHTTHSPLGRPDEEDKEDAQPSFSPSTLRPSSSALDTIVEGASVDHDTSIADDSVFGFDRYRFSSASTQSEPTGAGSRCSPLNAAQSEAVTGRTSRSSSRLSDLSSYGASASFRPKELVLGGLAGHISAGTRSAGLSRSTSTPVLIASRKTFSSDPRSGQTGKARSDTVQSPMSPRCYLTPTPTLPSDRYCQPPLQDGSDAPPSDQLNASGLVYASQDSGASFHDAYGSIRPSISPARSSSDLATPKRPPSAICISRATPLDSVPVDEDDYSLDPDITLSGRLKHQSSLTIPQTPNPTIAEPNPDPDSSMKSDSLSPPRSAASASSENIELVSWQVATTDSDSNVPRRSEEIFRPLSMAVSMSRSGLGSSRDTILSQARATAEEGALKGGVDFVWGRAEGEARRGSEEVLSIAARANIASDSSTTAAKPSWQGRSVEIRSVGPTSVRNSFETRSSTISSPSGGIGRLLIELEAGPRSSATDDPLSGSSVLHRRSATHTSPSILPRSSSIRRRHQSVDAQTGHRRPLSQNLGLDSVLEDDHEPRADDRASTTDESASWIVRSDTLRLIVGAFLTVYQALFLVFEAPFLWSALSPSLPLVASFLFLVPNILLIQSQLIRSVREKLLLSFFVLLVPTMTYCATTSAIQIVKMAKSTDRGATAPGIHVDKSRGGSESALGEVLRDVPMTALLFVLGVVCSIGAFALTTLMAIHLSKRRKKAAKGSGAPA